MRNGSIEARRLKPSGQDRVSHTNFSKVQLCRRARTQAEKGEGGGDLRGTWGPPWCALAGFFSSEISNMESQADTLTVGTTGTTGEINFTTLQASKATSNTRSGQRDSLPGSPKEHQDLQFSITVNGFGFFAHTKRGREYLSNHRRHIFLITEEKCVEMKIR